MNKISILKTVLYCRYYLIGDTISFFNHFHISGDVKNDRSTRIQGCDHPEKYVYRSTFIPLYRLKLVKPSLIAS